MGKIIPLNIQKNIFEEGILIIFGPNFLKATEDVLKETHGNIEFKGNTIFTCKYIDDIKIPKSLTRRCILIFNHYLPAAKGRKVTNEDIEIWREQLLSGINIRPELSDGLNSKFESASIFGNKTDNELVVFIGWTNVNTDFCVKVAKEFERSYKANKGYYNAKG
jgi:hypothetical protein